MEPKWPNNQDILQATHSNLPLAFRPLHKDRPLWLLIPPFPLRLLLLLVDAKIVELIKNQYNKFIYCLIYGKTIAPSDVFLTL